MIIWAAFPSIDPTKAEEATARWGAKGYRTLVVLNKEKSQQIHADLVFRVGAYEGYFRTLNFACQKLVHDHHADVVVCAGDSVRPVEGPTAHELGTTFAAKFPNGFGVMQPVGDHWGDFENDLHSPWVGKRFVLGTYGGRGPFYERYFQFEGGRELCAVAKRMGVLWFRDDVSQYHDHWSRKGLDPDFYQKSNRDAYTEKDKATFLVREAEEFAGYDANALETVPSLWFPNGSV